MKIKLLGLLAPIMVSSQVWAESHETVVDQYCGQLNPTQTLCLAATVNTHHEYLVLKNSWPHPHHIYVPINRSPKVQEGEQSKYEFKGQAPIIYFETNTVVESTFVIQIASSLVNPSQLQANLNIDGSDKGRVLLRKVE